jgi:hypothetical protein
VAVCHVAFRCTNQGTLACSIIPHGLLSGLAIHKSHTISVFTFSVAAAIQNEEYKYEFHVNIAYILIIIILLQLLRDISMENFKEKQLFIRSLYLFSSTRSDQKYPGQFFL